MTQRFKPTHRQQQQQINPTLPKAERKLNEQINKSLFSRVVDKQQYAFFHLALALLQGLYYYKKQYKRNT